MAEEIFYGLASELTSSITLPATLTVTETDLLILTDLKHMQYSQLTVMGSVTLGGVASATFYYYYSPDGTTWYPVSLYNNSTGEMTQRIVLLDSGTGTHPASGKSRFVDNVALGGTFQFKITGLSASGTPTIDSLRVFGRNN